MKADILFYSFSAESAPPLREIKESHRYLHDILSAEGINTSSGIKVCLGKTQFQDAVKESLSRAQLIIVMDSYTNYPLTAKDIICRGIGCGILRSEKLLKSIENKTRIPKSMMSDELLHISCVPENARVFECPDKIDPALLLTAGKQSILILPYQREMIQSLFLSSLRPVINELAGKFFETVSFNVASDNQADVLSQLNDIIKSTEYKSSVAFSADSHRYYTTIQLKAVADSPLDARTAAANCLNFVKKSSSPIAPYIFGNVKNADEHALAAKLKAQSKRAVLFEAGDKLSADIKNLLDADSDNRFIYESAVKKDAMLALGVKKSLLKKRGEDDPNVAALTAEALIKKYSADFAVCLINSAKPAFVYCDSERAALIKFESGDSFKNMLDVTDNGLKFNFKTENCIPLSDIKSKKQLFEPMTKNIPDEDKKNKMPLSSKIALTAASLIFVVSASYIANYFIGSYMNSKANTDLVAMVGEGQADITYPADFDPRFAALYAINQDMRGMLSIENTGVNYPVVQASDNSYYLRRDFYKNDNRHGSIFLDKNADIRTPCSNIVLYGHNMKDGQMFGELLKYEDIDYYRRHPIINFDSMYRSKQYKIIAVFLADVSKEGYAAFPYTSPMNSPSPDSMQTFISDIRKRSLINTTVDVQNTDKLLTLSTCDYTFEDARFVVVAREVRSGETDEVDVNGATYNQNPLMPR